MKFSEMNENSKELIILLRLTKMMNFTKYCARALPGAPFYAQTLCVDHIPESAGNEFRGEFYDALFVFLIVNAPRFRAPHRDLDEAGESLKAVGAYPRMSFPQPPFKNVAFPCVFAPLPLQTSPWGYPPCRSVTQDVWCPNSQIEIPGASSQVVPFTQAAPGRSFLGGHPGSLARTRTSLRGGGGKAKNVVLRALSQKRENSYTS